MKKKPVSRGYPMTIKVPRDKLQCESIEVRRLADYLKEEMWRTRVVLNGQNFTR